MPLPQTKGTHGELLAVHIITVDNMFTGPLKITTMSFLENKMSSHRLNALLQGPGSNDCSLSERVINVATSLPFIAVGVCTQRWLSICAPCRWQLQVQWDNEFLHF